MRETSSHRLIDSNAPRLRCPPARSSNRAGDMFHIPPGQQRGLLLERPALSEKDRVPGLLNLQLVSARRILRIYRRGDFGLIDWRGELVESLSVSRQTSLPSGDTCLFIRPLVGSASLVSHSSTLARDLALPLSIHRCEAAILLSHGPPILCDVVASRRRAGTPPRWITRLQRRGQRKP